MGRILDRSGGSDLSLTGGSFMNHPFFCFGLPLYIEVLIYGISISSDSNAHQAPCQQD
jgi:hypothetical protein